MSCSGGRDRAQTGSPGALRTRKNGASPAHLIAIEDSLTREMSDSKSQLPIDPKELVPAGIGMVLGVALIVGFVLLATSIGLTLLVDHGDIPHQ